MMRKAALHNLGCKVNAYETEAMCRQLEKAGYEIVPFDEKADVYVVNTCSVTNIADRKSRQMLHRARKQNPEGVVVAAGCYAQVAADRLREDEGVDILIGTDEKSRLAEALEEYFQGRGRSEASEKAGADTEVSEKDGAEAEVSEKAGVEAEVSEKAGVETEASEKVSGMRCQCVPQTEKISGHVRAFIKIQDGCNQFCSYCIIPYARGRARSRSREDILKEAGTLVEAGYREIVLAGIHISSYGIDAGDKEAGKKAGAALLDLVEALAEIPGLARLRLSSLEPRIVTDEFARRLSSLDNLCPHFHLSLQSGSDTVLRRMNRHYTAAMYREGCAILRQWFDRPAITTDVITGFPGETEEEFAQTERFIREIGFYELHVFPYSRREGTRAAAMEGQLSEAVKKERSSRLLRLNREMSLAYRRSFLGNRTEVLMEEKMILDGREYMVGHTSRYVKAAVPWEESLRGRMVSGRLDRMLDEQVALLV